MISVLEFIEAVKWNAARVNEYKNGKMGNNGFCDCIGLVMGALDHLGIKWNGLHGTNWTVRHMVNGFREISGINSLSVGDLVFKSRSPGEAYYNLPDRYKSGTDLKDYYHVGVVLETAPTLSIIHCTSVPGGIAYDNKIGKWKWAASSCYVDESVVFSMPLEETYEARVTADNGFPVKMRKSDNEKADWLMKIEVGKTVTVLEDHGNWKKISYEGTDGYMKSEFLYPISPILPTADSGESMVTFTLPKSIANKVYDALGAGLGYGVG